MVIQNAPGYYEFIVYITSTHVITFVRTIFASIVRHLPCRSITQLINK